MKTTAISPALGVEVSGDVDLENPAVVGRLTEALKWRGVLLFRGLNLDDDAQLAFSRNLGQLVQPVPGHEIFTVSLDPAKSPSAEYLKGTFSWHIDDTTNDIPAKATVLTCRHVAAIGGGTEFANTYAAYENLSEAERKRYEGLRVVHSFEAAQRLVYPNPTEEQVGRWRQLPPPTNPHSCGIAATAAAPSSSAPPPITSSAWNPTRAARSSTNCRHGQRRNASATPTTGRSATWSCGTIPACCTGPFRTTRPPSASCAA